MKPFYPPYTYRKEDGVYFVYDSNKDVVASCGTAWAAEWLASNLESEVVWIPTRTLFYEIFSNRKDHKA